VLLACALARTDPFGYFIATAVREPLSLIMRKKYDVPGFIKHLKQFSDPQRGCILTATGAIRKRRYRFANPLMQPYVVMHGLIDKRIDRVTVERETFYNQPS
jgi:hypothetical protein